MDLDEVLSPYFKNFRRIFYKQTEQGEERLSVIKLTLIGIYLLATLFAFLQFTITEPVLQCVAVTPFEEEVISVLDCQIQMTIFGQIAHTLNFLLLIGILFFFLTQDKPLSVWLRQIRNWASQSSLHLVGLIVGVSGAFVYTLSRLWSADMNISTMIMALSYEMGFGMNVIWWLIQPILFLGGSLLLINTYMQLDPSFKARYGDLTKPTKKTAQLLLVCLSIAIIFLLIAAAIFHVSINTGETLNEITRVAGVGFYQGTIYWLVLHFFVILFFAGFNLFILGVVYGWKRSRTLTAVILGSLFGGTFLIAVIQFLSQNPTQESLSSPLDIDPITYVIIFGVILAIILIFVLLIVRYALKKEPEFLNSRATILPWILFAGMVSVVLAVFPALFAMEGRFKSLSNGLDFVGLMFTLFLGIIRVVTISESSEPSELPISRNPRSWLNRIRIPAYVKTLALFYLAFVGFYLTLETHTISVMLNDGIGIQNDFRILKLQVLMATSSFGLLWVFWRYKPLTQTDAIITEQSKGTIGLEILEDLG